MPLSSVFITGTACWHPDEVITNAELVASFNQYVNRFNQRHARAIANQEISALQESSEEFILKASGIKQRYVLEKSGILDPDRMSPILPERPNSEPSIQAEMSARTAAMAIANAGIKATDIDLIIVACSNLQRAYPAMAIEVQALLGARGYGYDMNVACSSATFAMAQAANAIRSGQCQKAVVVSPEITSAHLAWQDRDCHFIFGDVCTALVLEGKPTHHNPQWEIVSSKSETVFSSAIRNNAGFLNRCDLAHRDDRDKLFMQEGRKVFKEVCPIAADHMLDQLAAFGFRIDQVRRFWLHQANLAMNQLIMKKMLGREASADEAPIILDRYANTASAGSIIAFHENSADLMGGDVGMICSFGAGYSIGSHLVRKV
jgi:beta-ketodecanoyl-[acyl-carrier-protein] synthase